MRVSRESSAAEPRCLCHVGLELPEKSAYRLNQTMYQPKHGLLSNHLRQQLLTPTIAFA